jgi:hypothetical protein
VSLRWERRTETPSGAVCARAEKTPQGLKSDAPGADASPGPTSKECSRTKETSSAPRLPSPLAVATPVPAPAVVSGSVARGGCLAGRCGGFEVVVGGGREAGGGQQREEKQRPRDGPVTWDRGSDLGSAKIVRSVRRGGARSGARGGRIDARGGGERSESTRGVDIGSGAHLMTRVTRVPVTQSGSEPHLLKHFISLGSSVQNRHFVRAGPLRRSEARCRPRRVSSLRRLRTASALAGSRR